MSKVESIQSKIESNFEEMSNAERRVARVILANYPLSGLDTIAGVSEKANVSDPTVLRLVNKLGYKRYVDFQNALKDEIDQWMQGPLSIQPESTNPKSNAQNYLTNFKEVIKSNVEETFQSISVVEFEGILKVLMDNNKRVHLLGGEFTESISRYLYFHLRKMRPQVHLIQGQVPTRIDHLLDLGKKDILIVFDVRRYQPDIVEFATLASQKVSSLILITDQWLSPMAKHANYVLPCRVTSVSRWDSLVAMTAVIEALMSYFAELQWPKIKHRLETLEEIRKEIDSSQYTD